MPVTRPNTFQSSGPTFSAPPGASRPLVGLAQRVKRPIERFLHIEAAGGIVLLIAAAVALIWANSPWSESYSTFWHTPLGIRVGSFAFERSLEWFVNDGLMVIFFMVVGMEIRREIHQGELSDWQRAALPVAAAAGGMIVPALIYLAFAGAAETRSGWGVPMATDIAFAVGILTLLGSRVPAALRVLLLAVAVIDDLGAIIVIALFYSSGVSLSGLLIAALGFLGVLALQWMGVRSKWAYVFPAVVAWAGVYSAGIHPTLAGVILGLMTPVRPWLGTDGFTDYVGRELHDLLNAKTVPSSHDLARTLKNINFARRECMSPSESLIVKLHPRVAFGIMPLFALANAGVTLPTGSLDASSWSVVTAITVGLVVGKPVGVLLMCWIALRLRIGVLPAGLTMRHLYVLGAVAGVGFTMSLFIASLAFSDARLLDAAKLGILSASFGAAVAALLLGRLLLSPLGGVDSRTSA